MHQKLIIVCFYITLICSPCSLKAQVTSEDYNRADSVAKFNDLVYHSMYSPTWIDSTHHLWYKIKTKQGVEYIMINADNQKKTVAFDQEKLCKQVNHATGKEYKPYSIPVSHISFSKDLKTLYFILDSFNWKCSLNHYKLDKLQKVEKEKQQKYWGESVNELGNPPVVSPDSQWTASIREYNVVITDRKTNQSYQLSYDGSEGEFYSSYIAWSPDSKRIATYKVRDNKKRCIYFIESSPENQLQPILHKREYLKPGDALPQKTPSLFTVEGKRQIPVNADRFVNQYDLSNIEWRKDSRSFTFEYNQRGHQKYQIAEVNGITGDIKILVNEQSETFIDYSSKRYRYDADDGKEIIWASERDGWNHLYLIDGLTGEIKNQITRGEWVVRGVEHVDEKKRQIIFTASGMNPGEDPYYIHYYRIGFDGSAMTDLTPEYANHNAVFSDDFYYYTDVYSTVSQSPAAILRSTAHNEPLMQLEKADISELLSQGWQPPEAFTAKGRDGKTDIWGNIYRPTNFDSTRKYPVIEYIYAGPHSAFVQKSFRPYVYFNAVAELGFIVVQIDGMGTSHRSKAFHDVCWKNLKDGGFPDRILWIKAAAEIYPYIDTTRVGIYGGSAGGQNALAAMLFHPGFYKAAVSSCGCHDNRMDKIWWNEQFMGYPVGPHYAACSNVENAGKLQGKLLLLVGEIDDNVDPASTMQVVNALIKAGKEFEMLVLPGMNHTGGGKFGERKRRDFFVKNLHGCDPPDWNSIDIKQNQITIKNENH
ncbi:MAG: prolyl oligopeptidase family serine peptidase [Bacteroidales bacterium]|nr:prolyl oligopeptidase family serine peptidase [Bacteroidales bacterium]